MNYRKFLKEKLIKKVKPDFRQIATHIKRARKDLQTAEKVLTSDPTWAFTMIYHAMIRTGRALMYAHGYLPSARESHKTIVYFTREVLGDEYENIFRRFNRMRRRRHRFMYDAINNISDSEARSSLTIAVQMIEAVVNAIRTLHPQLDMFN